MAKAVLRTVKKAAWKLTAPVWPVSRMLMGKGRIVWREKDKDRKHIGYLRSDKTFREFRAFMKKQGFKKHYIAYKDVEELFSLRKIHNIKFQYHLRVYKNRRLTGHYEMAPETNPLKHLREVGLETKKEDFLNILGDWITFNKP